jgi:selenide,water dikinase
LEAILPQVASLNRKAMELALKFDTHACTDVTGFAVMGHTLELAKGSGVQIDLFYDKLPFYPNALDMYQKGETTGSNKSNRKLAEGFWETDTEMSREQEALLFDPQTSGGLVISVAEDQADTCLKELRDNGIPSAAIIGQVVGRNPNGRLRIT